MSTITSIALTALWEVIKSLFGKLPWGVMTERFIARTTILGMDKLASMTTNSLVREQVEIIKNDWRSKGILPNE
jgi:hypothetical protein